MPGRPNPNLVPASVNATPEDRRILAALRERVCQSCGHTDARHILPERCADCDCRQMTYAKT